MSIMTSLAVICIEAIQGDEARADLKVSKISQDPRVLSMRFMIQSRMTKSGRAIVTITQDQVDNLAGNCYEVIGEDGRSKIIISTRSVTHGALIIGIHTYHIYM